MTAFTFAKARDGRGAYAHIGLEIREAAGPLVAWPSDLFIYRARYGVLVEAAVSSVMLVHVNQGGQPACFEVMAFNDLALDTTPDAVFCASAAAAWQTLGRDPAALAFEFEQKWRVRLDDQVIATDDVLDQVIRGHVACLLRALQLCPDATVDQLVAKLQESGIDADQANRLVIFVPMAFAHTLLTTRGVALPATYLVHTPGKREYEQFSLHDEPIFEVAKAIATDWLGQPANASEVRLIAACSSEMQAVFNLCGNSENWQAIRLTESVVAGLSRSDARSDAMRATRDERLDAFADAIRTRPALSTQTESRRGMAFWIGAAGFVALAILIIRFWLI